MKTSDLQNVISLHFHRYRENFHDDFYKKLSSDAAAYVEGHKNALLNHQLTADGVSNLMCTTSLDSREAEQFLSKFVSKRC